MTTPEQQVVLEEVTAAMSLLEGYADVMMDRVGPEVVPSVATIRARFDAQRQRTGWRQGFGDRSRPAMSDTPASPWQSASNMRACYACCHKGSLQNRVECE